MKIFFSTNWVYLTGMLLFILLGGILLLIIDTGDLILFFSDNRTNFLDSFFFYGTKLGEEFSYLIFGIFCLFVRYRYTLYVALTGILVTILSFVLKRVFSQPRPSDFFRDLDLLDLINPVEGVDMLVGATSFPSGHTMSGFALFGLVGFLFPKRPWLGAFCFLCALIVGFSRIYLVQHFFKDVYLGAILGMIVAAGFYFFNQAWSQTPDHWSNRSLNLFRKRRGA